MNALLISNLDQELSAKALAGEDYPKIDLRCDTVVTSYYIRLTMPRQKTFGAQSQAVIEFPRLAGE
jgi:hypothetical protein